MNAYTMVNGFFDTSSQKTDGSRYQERLDASNTRTSHLFAWLMLGQWVAGMLIAVFISPYSWEGKVSYINAHVPMAFFLGGLLTSLPVYLAFTQPTAAHTRHIIAAAQMLWSALLIHLTGGRIETHFHVFGSLGFIAFFRDWKVLVTATLVIATEHFLRGLLTPESIYGISHPKWWRFLEHAWWVIFSVALLIPSCIRSDKELREISSQDAKGFMDAIQKVSMSSGIVNASADALEKLSNALSGSTLEQKSATDQLAVINEELSATSHTNAEQTSFAIKEIHNTQHRIERSRENITKLANAIENIRLSTNEIQSINNLVNEISYQTNILSLNAMIEASRSGEGNGGFKVVALEVKRLAERSASAAENINQLLMTNFTHVQQGVEVTQSIHQNFAEISKQIVPLVDAIQNIAHASTEQNEAIHQITLGLNSIDVAANKNKKLADETSSTVQDLQENSNTLSRVVIGLNSLLGSQSADNKTVSLSI